MTDNDLRAAIEAAMQDAWNDFTADTGCFPDAFELRGRKLYADFGRGNYGRMVCAYLSPWLRAVLTSDDTIEAGAKALMRASIAGDVLGEAAWDKDDEIRALWLHSSAHVLSAVVESLVGPEETQ